MMRHSEKCNYAVIVTTIAAPTQAVRRFCDHLRAPLIVIGDNKTPCDWAYDGADYYSVERQKAVLPKLAELLPFNHYCRKNFGYLIAAAQGATAIVDTDDDNIPLDNWCLPPPSGEFEAVQANSGFVNVYSAFTDQHIWPRGFPLKEILNERANLRGRKFEKRSFKVGVWQALANGDPDVDAVYRLTVNKMCVFENRPPLILDEGVLCPYNSQNTLTFHEFYPLLYLPCHVNFRFTDILRGLIGQLILWRHGARLGFFEATVFQERNEHDLFRDFLDEEPCYRHPYDVVETVDAALVSGSSVADHVVGAYQALARKSIVNGARELPILDAWLTELLKRMPQSRRIVLSFEEKSSGDG